MAKYRTRTHVEAKAEIEFNELELRALEAMTGYGADAFLKVFYDKLGRHYMQPHEAGLRSLFTTICAPVHDALAKVDAARKKLDEPDTPSQGEG